ncbi:glycosyltransferase family 2 protein [Terrimonas rubra]|uniref:Glycosyltransferase family 2 protein n=1 Tax=Terrimonas rubra TaxID=1035890 RepID=A0ABW6A661_9BACT
MNVDISIVVVNYNTSALTRKCIESINRYVPANLSYEIIVVDNNSKFEDYIDLTNSVETASGLKMIRNRKNLGFAGGFMTGALRANGNFLFFVNSDVLVIEDSFTPFVTLMNAQTDIGVCGGQVLTCEYKHEKSFDHFITFGYKVLGPWLYEKMYPGKKSRTKEYFEPIDVDMTHGCYMVFRKKYFDEVGGLDDNIFLYYEEMDICKRLQKKGHRVVMEPRTKIVHLGGASTPKNMLIKKELLISYLYVLQKNFGVFQFLLAHVFLSVVFFFKSIVKPKYFSIFFMLLFHGNGLTKSLKHKQKISPA